MIKDIILKSRSYRAFDESRIISRDELESLVDVARICPSAMNAQPLKYRLVYEAEEREALLALTKWGGMLTGLKLPPDGKHPKAFIVVCCDTDIRDNVDRTRFDAGVACQSIMLAACEIGLGGCIIGAFDNDKVSRLLRLDSNLTPIVILALGKPDETAVVCDVDETGSIAYYRDENNTHYVPKRSLKEIIIE